MELTEFPHDFSEFLKLLNAHGVEYLLVGGIAVAIHGYPRATADMDVWVKRDRPNAKRIVAALQEFGFDLPSLTVELFLDPDRIIRMGNAPIRIEVLTSIDGVNFMECLERSIIQIVDGSEVRVIGLADLKVNKLASGRNKDLADLENLP